jgi:hypothetical protein
MLRVIFMAALSGLLLCGCATITRSTTDQVQIMSNPPEAQARTSMGHVCVTPCTLQFSRKDEFSVIFTKPGYHSAEIMVRTKVAGEGAAGFAGNVIVGGLIGMAVDASSGATLEHFPNPVAATLMPLKKGEQPSVINQTPQLPPPAAAPNEAPNPAPVSDS